MTRATALLALLLAAAVPARAEAPAAVRAVYEVHRDGLHVATASESFERAESKYQIVSEQVPAGLLAMFVRTRARVTSAGSVTAQGLRPAQFDYGRLDDAGKNVSARFDWDAGLLRMSFEGRIETAPLGAGAQDRLSAMYQFMFLPRERLRELAFPMTSNGKKLELYRYRLAGEVTLDTALGRLPTLHLVKEREGNENGVEIWLATGHHLLPVRLLIVENDGTKFEQTIARLETR